MKYIARLLFCGFLALSFFNTALSQEKTREENTSKQQDSASAGAKAIPPSHQFLLFISPCHRRTKICPPEINNPPVIADIKLNKTELIADDSSESSDTNMLIKVFTEARDDEYDALIYKYEVSAGKIIGKQETVLWDLTGVKAGTYTITAAVDDGCGFCGNTITKTVIIK